MSNADDPGAIRRFWEELDSVVFLFGAGLSLGFIALYLLSPATVENAIAVANTAFLDYLNWAILLIVFLVVVFLLFLIVGPWGRSGSAMTAPSSASSRFSR